MFDCGKTLRPDAGVVWLVAGVLLCICSGVLSSVNFDGNFLFSFSQNKENKVDLCGCFGVLSGYQGIAGMF